MRVFSSYEYSSAVERCRRDKYAYCDWPLVADFGFFGFLGFFLCSVCGGEYDDAVVLLAGCANAAELDARTAAAIATVAADVSFFMRLSP